MNKFNIPVIKNLSIIILVSLLTAYLLMILHESGHAIGAIIFGADINAISFNFFDAHVSYTNTKLNDLQKSVVDISGALLPIIISCPLVSINKRNNLFSFIIILFWISSIAGLIPFFIPVNNSDTIHLINNSGLSQVIISVISGSLFILGIFYSYYAGIKNKLSAISKQLTQQYSGLNSKAYLKHLSLLGAMVIVLTIYCRPYYTPYNKEIAIENYNKICSVSLNSDSFEAFELAKIICYKNDTLVVKIKELSAKSIIVNYFNNNTKHTTKIFSMEGFMISGGGGQNYKIEPKEGEISILLTGKKLKGEISIYRKKTKVES